MTKIISSKASLKEYNAIDILKFVLSIFVVIIHSGVDKTFISPLIRTAVPLFFIISSYFFFSKLEKLNTKQEKRKALWNFVKRNLYLYIFWTIVQFPLVIYIRGYYHNFMPDGLVSMVRNTLLGVSFTGSWYMMSLAIGTIIIFFIFGKVPPVITVLITFPAYIICCFETNYFNLLGADSFILKFIEGYRDITTLDFYTSFPTPLFWISVGRLFAKNKVKVKKMILSLSLLVAALLLVVERYITLKYEFSLYDDCYLILALICPLIFLFVFQNNFTFKTSFRIREISTIAFVTHGCLGRILAFGLPILPFNLLVLNIIKIVLSLIIAIILTYIILNLENKKRFKILKYSH